MTKVTYIGNQPTKESKHIELVKYYHSGKQAAEFARQWEICELAKRNFKYGLDLILCSDSNGNGATYLGHWNDGTTSNPNTICTVLGEDVVKPKGKGIEFVKLVATDKSMTDICGSSKKAKDYENIIVLRFGVKNRFDVFLCYDDIESPNDGLIYLGHLNDGFVE